MSSRQPICDGCDGKLIPKQKINDRMYIYECIKCKHQTVKLVKR